MIMVLFFFLISRWFQRAVL